LGLPNFARSQQEPDDDSVPSKRRRTIGFDGEIDPNAVAPPDTTNGASSPPQVHMSRSPNAVSVDGSIDPLFTTQRIVDVMGRTDGSVELHVTVRCSLADIAKATNLRLEDAAFALHECGLVMENVDDERLGPQILISGPLIEKVAAERNVKEPCLNMFACK
jgi:histone acetyltransferase MYST1